jgi:hypothetical protein
MHIVIFLLPLFNEKVQTLMNLDGGIDFGDLTSFENTWRDKSGQPWNEHGIEHQKLSGNV